MKKFVGIIFLLVYFAGYAAILPGDFYYDDYHSIRNNTWLVSVKNIPRFFHDPGTFSSKSRAAMYRPMLLVSYALDYQLYHWRAWGWHLTNLLLHLLNVILAFILIRRTCNDEKLAWLGSLLFAFHPAAGENINYLNCRSSILLLNFLLAGIWAVSRLIENNDRGKSGLIWIVLANLFFALAVLSKETAAVFPGIAFLYYWIFSKAETRPKLSRLAGLLAPMLVLLAGYLYLRQVFFSRIISGGYLPRSVAENFFTELKSYFWYLGLFLEPARVSIEHTLQVEKSLWDPKVILSLAGILVLGVLAIYAIFRPKSKVAPFGFLTGFYFMVLAPTSSIVPLNVLVSERAFYPALLMPAVMLAALAEAALRNRRGWALAGLGIILACYLLIIQQRGRVWQSPLRLYQDAFQQAPDLPRVAGELANEYAREGRDDQAVKYYMLSDQLRTGEPATVFNLGAIYMDLGKLDLAEKYLQQAVSLDPNDAEARVNLGTVYRNLGKNELARFEFETAIKLDPKSALAHNNLGDLDYALGDFAGAALEFQKALALDPQMENSYYNLGLIYEKYGLYPDALKNFQKAYELNSGFPDNALKVGVVLIKMGKPAAAEDWIRKTLALDSKYDLAWYYLGLAKMKQGQKPDALSAFENALKFLKPNRAELKPELERLISQARQP